MALLDLGVACAERGLLPDTLLRAGIRRLLRERLDALDAQRRQPLRDRVQAFALDLRRAPIAMSPHRANEQHYEVPAEFFGLVLGKRRKYSSAWWPDGVDQLDVAEEMALAESCARAGLADGQRVLELGCGWGSLTLWIAERYPYSVITALSNSRSQREYIEARARERGLANIEVVTGDVSQFATRARFDRVVSVEMFEHLRNWPEMFRRIRGWLEPDGRFFMHVFVHSGAPYLFEERDASDWMARHFFAGGMMPSDDLPQHIGDDLNLVQRWRWDGTNYARTASAWLANMDSRRAALRPILAQTYGEPNAELWWTRWRLFFLSCAELFAYRGGQQWWVAHYLFEPRR